MGESVFFFFLFLIIDIKKERLSLTLVLSPDVVDCELAPDPCICVADCVVPEEAM